MDKIIARLLKKVNCEYRDISQKEVIYSLLNASNANLGSFYTPIQFIVFNTGYTVLASLPEYKDILLEHYKIFKEDLFSNESLNNIISTTKSVNLESGYEINNSRSRRYGYSFGCDNLSMLNKSKISNLCGLIDNSNKYPVMTKAYKQLQPDRQYCGTVIDEKIISICGYSYLGADAVDIGVETIPEHRQQGYGISNVILMSEYLLEKDKEVLYSCNNENKISQNLAKSAGFILVACSYRLWLEKIPI
ncbi:MAG: GNAT family protein [Eubacteriales bacterium]|nr:GNAT family protein [Eubacteriales bacterium]